MHPRTAIRQAVCTALRGETDAEGRVYDTRYTPLRAKGRSDLPAIMVDTPDETVRDDSKGTAPRELTMDLDLDITVVVAAGDDAGQAMDDLVEQIQAIMAADPYFGDVAADSFYSGATFQMGADGDFPVGIAELQYGFVYRMMMPEAPSDLDDFETAGVTYNQGGDRAPADDAHDVVVVQELP